MFFYGGKDVMPEIHNSLPGDGGKTKPLASKFSTGISTAVENHKDPYEQQQLGSVLLSPEKLNVRISRDLAYIIPTTGRKGNTRGLAHSTKKITWLQIC